MVISLRRVGIGVVGLGRIGIIHADIFATKVEGAKLVAVADVVEDLAKRIATRYGVRYYTEYEKFLKDPELDAVVICTPTFLHAEMCTLAAEHGKHVLCEKPLTVTVEDAKRVLKRVKEAGIKLQVGYMRRFDPAFSQAKERILRGEIGRPLVFVGIARDPAPPPGWAADPKLSGGIFLDMLSHDFDMARWLMGSEIREVYVRGGAMIYEEIRAKGDLDVVTISFSFENGALGIIHGSRKSAFGYDLRTEILGTKGTIYVGATFDPLFSIGTKAGLTFGGIQWFFKRFYDAYVEEDKHFIKCIKEGMEPLVGGIDGLRAVQIAEACWRSYREGRPIKIEI